MGKILVVGFFGAIGYSIYVSPLNALVVIGVIAGIVAVYESTRHRRLAKLRNDRSDTICDFGKSFNLRTVDPWIVRATHEALGAYLDDKQPIISLRASDSIHRDLGIHPEEMWELLLDVTERSGYDLTDCESNPLFGRITTVQDFVLFINQQPKARR